MLLIVPVVPEDMDAELSVFGREFRLGIKTDFWKFRNLPWTKNKHDGWVAWTRK
jgi:hypothetical protein